MSKLRILFGALGLLFAASLAHASNSCTYTPYQTSWQPANWTGGYVAIPNGTTVNSGNGPSAWDFENWVYCKFMEYDYLGSNPSGVTNPISGITTAWRSGALWATNSPVSGYMPVQSSTTDKITWYATLPTSLFPALTGDVTNTAGSLSTNVGRLNGVALSGLSTGLLKITTGTGAPSIATYTDVVNDWTAGGTCSSTTYLRGDGQCQTPAGGSSAFSSLTSSTNTTAAMVVGSGASLAPSSATAGVISANELNGTSLAGLATGILKNTTSTGVPSIATAGTDYVSPSAFSNTQVIYSTGSGLAGNAGFTFTAGSYTLGLGTAAATSANISTPQGTTGSANLNIFPGNCTSSGCVAGSLTFNAGNALSGTGGALTLSAGTGSARANDGIVQFNDGRGETSFAVDNNANLQTLYGLIDGGNLFTVSGCGTAGSIIGGAMTGSFTVGTGASPATCVITIGGATPITSNNGWACSGSDVTSGHLLALEQSATSVTTASLTGNMTTGDKIIFMCRGY